MLKKIVFVFLISILPVIELRGAIPAGAIMEVPFYWNALAAIIGNILPVPFILMFIPKILDFLTRFKVFRPIVGWLRRKADKHSVKIVGKSDASADVGDGENTVDAESPTDVSVEPRVGKNAADAHMSVACDAEAGEETASPRSIEKRRIGAFVGLLLFVMIPCPGTGAWTGSLVAALFGLPKRESFLAVLLGVLGCAVIMCLASYGVVGFLSFLAK